MSQAASSALDRKTTALAVIDLQESFRPAVLEFDQIAKQTAVLVEAAQLLGLPVLATEQYPKGLGKTVEEVAGLLTDEITEKVSFSALAAEGFKAALERSGCKQVLLAGVESHVCVYQTVQDLLSAGFDVQVVCDAVSSRTQFNRDLGIKKMEHLGASLTSVETALFELLGSAGTEEFKSVQRLIK